MATEGGINGTAVFAALVGSIMLYSGVKGKAISSTIKSLVEGKTLLMFRIQSYYWYYGSANTDRNYTVYYY